ncbi:MAG: M61 family peptidase, partial [Candidatus Marinimicrobia bacterium]|nr:M61 family peptidase [Candidatus Neomarinimicrobiota bacterium]
MIRPLSALPLCVMAALIASAPLDGQEPVVYHISFDNRAHHEAAITATFSNLPAKPLTLRMSRSSPGRYSLHEFARHVNNLRAEDGRGRALSIYRPDPHSWTVGGHDGLVKVTYTLFGDQADGTSTGIDETHAHLNMPATFIWAEEMQDHPVRVIFVLPERDWQIVTQLPGTRWSDTFTAPNLQYFMDSPTEIGPVVIREWTTGDAQSATLRLAMHHTGSDEEVDAFAELAKAIVDEETAIWGELPTFDYGTYTFIADYLPHVSGDGMEHRNSTILTSSGSLKTNLRGITGTLAHEFLHAWMANYLRDPTAKNMGRLTLNPSKHMERWGTVIIPLFLLFNAG